ncbi:MAG TPA: dockerin type I domain-containing protein [Ruminococcus flavefaciens]|nr:dockerin type I domain-containing protein [Ruminococcus flavefaciens]
MFTDSKSIVGGNGTKYNERIYYSEYACVDRNGKPGYFTKNPNAPKPNTTVTTTTTSTTTTMSATTTTTVASTTTSDEKITTVTSSVPVNTVLVMGDVTGDAIIDARDATDVLTEYAKTSTGQESKYTEEQKKSADVNNDNIIDGRDATAILTYYAKTSVGGTMTLEEYMESIK